MANKASAVHEMLLKYPTISLDVLIDLGLSKTRTQSEEKKLRELAGSRAHCTKKKLVEMILKQ